MSEVFFLLVDLALKRGHHDIKGQVIELDFGEIWKVTINGKREQHGKLPPLHAFVECNGWPVTIIGPTGGAPIIGVSEAELIAALKAAAGASLPPEEPQAPGMEQQTLPLELKGGA